MITATIITAFIFGITFYVAMVRLTFLGLCAWCNKSNEISNDTHNEELFFFASFFWPVSILVACGFELGGWLFKDFLESKERSVYAEEDSK